MLMREIVTTGGTLSRNVDTDRASERRAQNERVGGCVTDYLRYCDLVTVTVREFDVVTKEGA